MKNWAKQLAGAILVLVFALAVGGFVMVLRAQQSGLAATMAAANILAVSPADGAVNVPISGEIRADYISRPSQDPTIKVESPVGVTLDNAHWDGMTFVLRYDGLRADSLYHVELDQDSWTGKGEHKQIKVRWSFRTGSVHIATPTPTIAASPTATPAISPTPTLAAAPDLIWYSGQNGASGNGDNGIDWNGRRIKTIKWVGTTQSPDGQRIYNSITPSTWVYDADGNQVGSVAGSAASAWADDSAQFCGIRRQATSAPYNLVLMPLDGTVHTVGTVTLAAAPGSPPPVPRLAACSDLSGRAIVVGVSNSYIWSMAMISLTDGSVIYQTRYPNPVRRLTASHDGRYVAEQVGINPSGASTTLIRELPSGNIVGQMTGIEVTAFSWDGSLVAGGMQGNSGLTGAEVLRWQDRKVIWNQCGCTSPYAVQVLAQPNGSKLAIAVSDQHGVGTLTIVDSVGRFKSVPVGTGPFLTLF